MTRFIHCIDCGQGFRKSPFDQFPEYEYDPGQPSETVRIVEKDDFREFLVDHQGHRIEYLKIVKDSFVSEKDDSEPVKISYFKACNEKKETFVIKQFREHIGEPLKYQVIPGDYSLEFVGVGIQSDEIIKQLETEVKIHPVSGRQISAFLKLYRRIVRNMDIKNLESVSQESSHPLEIFYKMDDTSLFYLLRNCRRIFKGQEYVDIEEFISRHRDDGVLLLKITYQIQINERVRSKKEDDLSAAIRSEDLRVIKKQ
jgi:hypothetical protein